MNLSSLMQNKPLLFGIIGVVVLVLVLALVFGTTKGKTATPADKPITQDVELLTTDNIGKAIEIQSLLAREGIEARRSTSGSKSTIILKKEDKITRDQWDRALLTIVKSGIMDKNIGLEIFDKGDFTSSKEDKRIRLSRAINGELSRLIRKIPPIEDASVFVSIPDQSIFKSMQKPISATVQVTMPVSSGNDEGRFVPDKLDRDKVKAITNLLMGSIQGLEAKNISITDTNGNVYSSVISPEDDMMTLLEEKDQYMKNKVVAQLDRLLGKGNYVVTVSTYLREAPLDTNKLIYDSKDSAVIGAQKFRESLGDKSSDQGKISSVVSSYIPGGLPAAPNSSSNRAYSRSAEELQYGVGRTQVSEERRPGMIEEISVAVTLDQGAMPAGMSIEDLKVLVAKAANPKVDPQNVQIAFADMSSPLLASDRPVQLPKAEESGNPWWTVAVLLGVVLIAGLIFIAGRVKESAQRHEREIEALIEKSELQQNQIREAQHKAARLQALQEQIQQSLVTNQTAVPPLVNLQDTINNIKDDVDEDMEEADFALQLKSWIESTG